MGLTDFIIQNLDLFKSYRFISVFISLTVFFTDYLVNKSSGLLEAFLTIRTENKTASH